MEHIHESPSVGNGGVLTALPTDRKHRSRCRNRSLGRRRRRGLYSRGGDDISHTFPEMLPALDFPAILDGELLVQGTTQGGKAGGAASFNALQQRLGRKTVSKKMLAESPAFVRVYDVLSLDGENLREKPWSERRAVLEQLIERLPAERFDLSAIVDGRSISAEEIWIPVK